MRLAGFNTEQKIWYYFINQGFSECGVAGIMGNLYAESGLHPNNLQNTYEKKLGYTDSEYTEAVDNGSYINFVNDQAGYGLAQWTYWSRKQELLNFAEEHNKSIGDLGVQLEFLHKELKSYKTLYPKLKNASSVREASDAMLLEFERPANQSQAVKDKRTQFGETYYNKYKKDKKEELKMKSSEFINRLQDIVDNYKTLYVMGCYGSPLTGSNVSRYCQNHSYNKQASRTKLIKANANKNPPVFGFDCVCLIKGVLWGWNGNKDKTYGGASYATNGVPDISANEMINRCKEVSTDFSNIIPGEAVWLSGHIGVYIGNGKVIECSPAFKNCVQITACLNVTRISNMNGRKWVKHGKLPYITYDTISANGTSTPVQALKPSGGGLAYRVGEIVYFSGSKSYVNAVIKNGVDTKPGLAKITAISSNADHPYHLVKENGGGSNIYGWADAKDVMNPAVYSIKKLEKAGVLNSPDYWIKLVNDNEIKYLDALFQSAANKIKKAGIRKATVADGVYALVNAKVINSPDYWTVTAAQNNNIGELLKTLGGSV